MTKSILTEIDELHEQFLLRTGLIPSCVILGEKQFTRLAKEVTEKSGSLDRVRGMKIVRTVLQNHISLSVLAKALK